MGLDGTVRCRCFEEGKLKPGPVPIEDVFIDEEGYLASRKLSDAYSRYSYRQVQARYGALERAFHEWSCHGQTCEHEDGEYCYEHVDNWSGVRMFCHWCEVIGEDKLPILSHIMPRGNGGIFPAEKAAAALAELDIFDAELDALLEADPTDTLIDAETGEEIWSSEDGEMTVYASDITKSEIRDGKFRLVAVFPRKGEIVFESSHFILEYFDDPKWKGEDRQYWLTCLDSGASIKCDGGFELCKKEKTELRISSRKAWSFMYANVALRSLLTASLETGNPIRWC